MLPIEMFRKIQEAGFRLVISQDDRSAHYTFGTATIHITTLADYSNSFFLKDAKLTHPFRVYFKCFQMDGRNEALQLGLYLANVIRGRGLRIVRTSVRDSLCISLFRARGHCKLTLLSQLYAVRSAKDVAGCLQSMEDLLAPRMRHLHLAGVKSELVDLADMAAADDESFWKQALTVLAHPPTFNSELSPHEILMGRLSMCAEIARNRKNIRENLVRIKKLGTAIMAIA